MLSPEPILDVVRGLSTVGLGGTVAGADALCAAIVRH